MSKRFRTLLTFGMMLGVASLLGAQESSTQTPQKSTNRSQGTAGQDQGSSDKQSAQDQERDGARKQGKQRQGKTGLGKAAGQRAGRRGGQGQSGQLDSFIATAVVLENENEIALSKLAQQRATNPEVKAFAQQMVTEHTAFLEKLRPFDQRQAGAHGQKGSQGRQGSQQQRKGTKGSQDEGSGAQGSQESSDAQGGAQGSRKTGEQGDSDQDSQSSDDSDKVGRSPRQGAAGTSAGAQAAQGGQGGQDSIQSQELIQFKTELAERCQQSAQRELEEHQGAEFDRAFMAMQVMAHMKMADELEVAQNHVSGELKQILSEGAETAQKHLRHAKEIKMQLKGSEGDAARTTQKQNQKDEEKK